MRVSISKKGLREALTAMSLIVRSKASLPVLGCARIEVRGNRGEVRCTDLEQSLSWFVGDAAGEGAFLADLKELREYLRNGGSSGTVEFESSGTETSAVFHEGGIPVVRRFKGFSLDDWPVLFAPEGEGAKVGSEFFENVRKAAPSASDDTSRRVLRGVMLEPGAVVATNGRELVRLHCATGVKDGVVIPVTKFLQSARFAGNGGRVVVDEDNGAGRLVVSTDDWEYSVKRVEGTYPDYRRVIPKTKGSVLELSAASIAYLRKGLPLLSCGDEHQTVHLHADTAGLKVLASNFDGPRLEVGEGLKSGDPVSMSVDRRLLSRALELGFARFAFSGKDNYGPVAAYGGGGDVFVFMPLRADNSERIVKAAVKSDGVAGVGSAVPEKAENETGGVDDRVRNETMENERRLNDRSKRKEVAMQEERQKRENGFQVVGENGRDGFDALLEGVMTVRAKSKDVFEFTGTLAKLVKEAQRLNRTREREFKSTRDLLGKLKKVSGF